MHMIIFKRILQVFENVVRQEVFVLWTTQRSLYL